MHVDTCTTLFICVQGSNLTDKMKINTNILILMVSVFLASVLVISVGNLSEVYAQTDSPSNNDSTTSQTNKTTTSSDSIPTAQSVYDTGVMALPLEVK